jgi:hypothetical protein
LIVVAASMAIAAVSWRFVEQPVRRRKLFGERRALFGGAATLVAAAVAFGVSIPAMSGWPGRLTVAVQNILAVKSDADRFGTHKCMTEARDTRVNSDAVRQGKLCVMGSPGDGAPEFLVWGDSHAAAMAPAIDSAAARSRKRGLFVGRGGCPPLVDYDSMSLHRSRREACRERNDAVIDLVRNAKIPLVFLVGRWPREVLGAENGLEGPFYDPSAAYAIEDRSVQVAKALDATIAALAGLGARAVLVMDVPEPGYDVPVALARAQISKTAVNVNLARDAVRARQDPALKVLRQAAEKWGLAIIDPTPAFCDSRICRTEAAGVPLYRDADHISRTMALAISYLFDESFAASLPAR